MYSAHFNDKHHWDYTPYFCMNDKRLKIDYDLSTRIQCVLENFDLERECVVRLLPRLFEKFYEKYEIDNYIMTDYFFDDMYMQDLNNYDPVIIYENILGDFEPFRIINGEISEENKVLDFETAPFEDIREDDVSENCEPIFDLKVYDSQEFSAGQVTFDCTFGFRMSKFFGTYTLSELIKYIEDYIKTKTLLELLELLKLTNATEEVKDTMFKCAYHDVYDVMVSFDYQRSVRCKMRIVAGIPQPTQMS